MKIFGVFEIFLIDFDIFEALAVIFGKRADMLKGGFGDKIGNSIRRELLALLLHRGNGWFVSFGF